MRPFGYPITILNTIDHLGKFDGKADEGFFIRRIVEENLHIRFGESTPNVVGDKTCQNYILLPLWPADPPFSQDPKSPQDDVSKPLSDDEKKVNEDLRKDNEVNVVVEKQALNFQMIQIMHGFEDYSIFDSISDDQDDGAEANMNNLDTTNPSQSIPTIRIHKDHPLNQVIGDLQSATQTRNYVNDLGGNYGF
ncbi:hypothetical protein Tco_1104796 [Tanacetum coccineum]